MSRRGVAGFYVRQYGGHQLTLPGDVRALLSRALDHHRAGRLADAAAMYRRVLDVDPAQPDALHLLGVVAHAGGDHAEADRLIEAAIATRPADAAALSNHGVVLRALGRCAEALARYDQALAITADLPDTQYNRGVLLREQGDLTGALASYDRALAVDPGHADALRNRGNVLLASGRTEDAVDSYRKALAIRPDDAAILCNLGDGLRALRLLDQAGDCYVRAIDLAPGHTAAWIGFSEFLSQTDVLDERLAPYIVAALRHPNVDPQCVQPAAAALIVRDSFTQELLASLATTDDGDRIAKLPAAGTLRAFLDMPLLIAVLEESILTRFDLERLLIALRSTFLFRIAADPRQTPSPATVRFLSALAQQCFTNEYVWVVSDEEKAAVENLVVQIGEAIEREDVPHHCIAIVAAYVPLCGLPYADALERAALSDTPLTPVLRRQVAEPREERRIRDLIPRLTPVTDAVSTVVREQYEQSPYPRWRRRGNSGEPKPLCAVIGEIFPGRCRGFMPNGPTEVLVAGCGTGSHPVQLANALQNARILAVDLSRTSLAFARRMTDAAGLSIEYAQADILALADWDRRFDLVDATGVLHHMGDPLSGWSALRRLVRPGGFMKIGLYSRLARRNLIRLQQIVSARGLPPSADAIRAFRREVMTGDLRPLLGPFNGVDFCSLSACRDLLFHVQEHDFAIPDIASALERLGLVFLGFEFRNPVHRRRYRKRFPEDVDEVDLGNWVTFEQEFPDTFVGMYQFWCRG